MEYKGATPHYVYVPKESLNYRLVNVIQARMSSIWSARFGILEKITNRISLFHFMIAYFSGTLGFFQN